MADIGFLSSFHLFPLPVQVYSHVVINSKIYICVYRAADTCSPCNVHTTIEKNKLSVSHTLGN
jgi:hypothetical protein